MNQFVSTMTIEVENVSAPGRLKPGSQRHQEQTPKNGDED